MRCLKSLALASAALFGVAGYVGTALAQDRPLDLPPHPGAQSAMGWPGHAAAPAWRGPEPQFRNAWLSECRRRQFAQDRSWDVDDHGRNKKRHHRNSQVIEHTQGSRVDYCAAYFDDYYATQATNAHPAYGHGYAMHAHGAGCCPPVPMMVPAPMRREPECQETITVEYIDTPVPARRVYRAVPRRVVPDKRIRVVPDKRVRAN